MKRVLDAGAVISGFPLEDSLTVPEVIDEVLSKQADWNLAALESRGLSVRAPSGDSVEKVRRASKETGDLDRLSYADASLVALALEFNATLVTDDYSVQNVCSVLGVPYKPIEKKGIDNRWKWAWFCRKCKKKLSGKVECPICGGEPYQRRVE